MSHLAGRLQSVHRDGTRGRGPLLLVVVLLVMLSLMPAAVAAPTSQIRDELRASLAAADADRRVPRSTVPRLAELNADQAQLLQDGCAAGIEETRHRVCTYGDPEGDRTVVLLGSSHMTMWLNGLEAPAAEGGTRMLGLFKFGCSPLVLRTRVFEKSWPECADWRRWALRRIERIAPDLVVIGTHTYTNIQNRDGGQLRPDTPRYDRAYAAGLRRLVARLTQSSEDVVMLGGLALRSDKTKPGNCLQRTGRRYRPCEGRKTARTREMLARDRRATLAAGGRFFDSNLMTCLGRRCPVAAGGIYIYRDFSHVSRTWSVHIGSSLSSRIGLTG